MDFNINFESMLQLRNELQFINLISNFNIAENLWNLDGIGIENFAA